MAATTGDIQVQLNYSDLETKVNGRVKIDGQELIWGNWYNYQKDVKAEFFADPGYYPVMYNSMYPDKVKDLTRVSFDNQSNTTKYETTLKIVNDAVMWIVKFQKTSIKINRKVIVNGLVIQKGDGTLVELTDKLINL